MAIRVSSPPLDPSTLLRMSGVGGSHSEKEEDEEGEGTLMLRLSKYEQEGRGPIGIRISNPPLDPSTLLRVSGVGGSHSEKEED